MEEGSSTTAVAWGLAGTLSATGNLTVERGGKPCWPWGGNPSRYLGPYTRARKRSGLIFPRHVGAYWATLTRTYPRVVTQLGSARGDFPPCYGHQPLRGVCIAQRTGRPGVKEHAVFRCVCRLLPLSWKSHLSGLKTAIRLDCDRT